MTTSFPGRVNVRFFQLLLFILLILASYLRGFQRRQHDLRQIWADRSQQISVFHLNVTKEYVFVYVVKSYRFFTKVSNEEETLSQKRLQEKQYLGLRFLSADDSSHNQKHALFKPVFQNSSQKRTEISKRDLRRKRKISSAWDIATDVFCCSASEIKFDLLLL